MVCYHPARFGGYKHCGSRDIKVLICLVISEEHVTRELCSFSSTSDSR